MSLIVVRPEEVLEGRVEDVDACCQAQGVHETQGREFAGHIGEFLVSLVTESYERVERADCLTGNRVDAAGCDLP